MIEFIYLTINGNEELFYLSKGIIYHRCLEFLFEYKGYLIYYRNLGFDITPYMNEIKESFEEMFKENDINLINL